MMLIYPLPGLAGVSSTTMRDADGNVIKTKPPTNATWSGNVYADDTKRYDLSPG